MNFKTTIFLLVLVLLVGAYFVFVDRKAPTTQEQNEAAAQQGPDGAGSGGGTPLFTADKLSTEAVRIVSVEMDGKKLVLKKEGSGGSGGSGTSSGGGGDWSQVEPVRFPLNTWSVQGVIDAAAGLRYTRKLEASDKERPSLEQLKLAPPQAVVTLTTGPDKVATFTLKLGRTTLGGRGYVMIDNDPAVYVVTDTLHKLLRDQQPDSWRRKTVQAPTESQSSRVTLVRNGQTVEVVKLEGNWAFAPPLAGRADSKAIAGLLTGVTGMYIDKFVADAPADLAMYGLDKPTITLAATLPPAISPSATSQPATKPSVASVGTIKTLRIGSPVDLTKESYYATWNDGEGSGGVVFTIPKSTIEKFAKTVDDLRDPRITPLAAADVHELTIERSGGPVIRLSRGPAGWDFSDTSGIPEVSRISEGFKADNDEVSKLVDSIVDAKATGYQRVAALTLPQLGPIVTAFTLTAIGKSEPDVLRVYQAEKRKEGESRWLVIRNNESTGYLVPQDKLPAVSASALSLRDRTVFDLPKDLVNGIVIRQTDGTILTFVRSVSRTTKHPTTRPAIVPGPWALTTKMELDGHEKQPVVHTEKFEAAAFDALLGHLLQLRAEKWVEPSTRSFSNTMTSVEVTTADGDRKRLQIFTATGEAGAGGISNRFEVSKSLIEALNQEFRDRTVLPIAAADFKQVAVTRDGRTITIHKDDDGKYVAGDDQKINQAAAGALFDTLGNLRVERYLNTSETAPKPELKISVETQAGQKITLSFPAFQGGLNTGDMSGSFGEKRFRLSVDVTKKLSADLTAKEKELEKAENAMPEAE